MLSHYQHLEQAHRFREVANVLAKHGFGFLFDRLSHSRLTGKLRRRKEEEEHWLGPEQRLRLALEEMGPTFIKMGQLASTRPDLVPQSYINELEKLQDAVPAFPFEQVCAVLKEEGISLEDFAELEEKPIAAASIGQVHLARLKKGDRVVVKVQRPGVGKVVETDLRIIFRLAALLERRTEWGRLYRVTEIAHEFAEALTREMDFSIEGRNADVFYHNFRHHKRVVIPRVYWQYTTRRVLTLEYVEGIKVSELAELKRSGCDMKKLAEVIVDSLFQQVYEHGFFHADPHPGNIAVLPGERIVYYDFGQVGHIDDVLKENCMDLVLAMTRYDVNGVTRSLLKLGIADNHVNREDFRRDIAKLQRKYYGLPLAEIKVGQALAELLELSFRYQVRIPPELSLVAKMMMTIEGLIARIDPEISIVEIAEPFGRRIMVRRLAPDRVLAEARNVLSDYISLTQHMPRYLDSVLSQLDEGELRVGVEHKNLRRLVNMADVAANRISLSVVIAGIIVGTSLMARGGYGTLPGGFNLVQVGFISGLVLGGFLIYSIIRSGRY